MSWRQGNVIIPKRYSLTVDSFQKRIFCVTILTAYCITEEVSIIS